GQRLEEPGLPWPWPLTGKGGEQGAEKGRRQAGRRLAPVPYGPAQGGQERGHGLTLIEERLDHALRLGLGDRRRQRPERRLTVAQGVGEQRPKDQDPEPQPAQPQS